MEIMMAVAAQDLQENEDGTLDIVGILTGVRVSAVPYVEPQVNLVVAFSANPIEVGTEKVVEIRLLAADGELMKGAKATITVPPAPRPGSRADFNVSFPLTNVPFMKPGDYGFHILVDSVERTIRFYISVEEGQE